MPHWLAVARPSPPAHPLTHSLPTPTLPHLLHPTACSSAPLRGSVAALPGEEDFLSAAHPSSAIELLFSSPEWEAGWLEAEHWDASRQLEAAVDAYTAWQPAALALGALGVDDLIPETPRGRWGLC